MGAVQYDSTIHVCMSAAVQVQYSVRVVSRPCQVGSSRAVQPGRAQVWGAGGPRAARRARVHVQAKAWADGAQQALAGWRGAAVQARSLPTGQSVT